MLDDLFIVINLVIYGATLLSGAIVMLHYS